MASVKTAVSLPQSLFGRADSLARTLHISRSQLFARAVEEFLKKHEKQTLSEALNRAYEDSPTPDERELLKSMRSKQRRLMEGEW